MLTHNIRMVADTLKEICERYEKTKNIRLKRIKYLRSKEEYLVTLTDDSKHIVPKEIINKYIESLGDRKGTEIAGHLLHSIDLEESILESGLPQTSDAWEGDIEKVNEYLKDKEEKENE